MQKRKIITTILSSLLLHSLSSFSITVQLQLQTKQCHLSAKQGVLVIYATDRSISGVCPHSIYLSPSHGDFLTPFDCLKTKGWQWKKVLWAFMAFGCHGRGVSSDTAASLQPQWPPPMGKAQLLQHWESYGKGRNALQCHISDRRTLESRGLWGGSCFCCVPKIVESGHWRWKTSSYSVVPLHSTGAETTQTTSPYTLLFCHFELSGTTTGEDWLILPQESFYRQDLRISDVCITSSGNQLFRVIIDYTNIHNNLWFLFPLGAPIFALKEWTHMIPMSCDPASAIYTDSRIKLINAFYNALLWLRLFVCPVQPIWCQNFSESFLYFLYITFDQKRSKPSRAQNENASLI